MWSAMDLVGKDNINRLVSVNNLQVQVGSLRQKVRCPGDDVCTTVTHGHIAFEGAKPRGNARLMTGERV